MWRRDFLKNSLAASIFGVAADPLLAGSGSYLPQSPDMLVAYLDARLSALAAKWDKVRDGLRTPGQVNERNRFVREKAREMVGGYPERTPLAPVVVHTHQRQGYRIENIMYQSQPDFWVTGNLYVPDGPGPFPAILSPCGHYPLARMYPDYQFVYMNLARAGFVVLAYDPIGQGERRYFWNPETGAVEAGIDDPVYEHSLPGTLLLLIGENLTGYRVWDGVRGIDYLLTRPEVIPGKIGCAGHSGGGTLTLFISAIDERVQCAVVNEGGTIHRWPMNVPLWSHLPSPDIEQNLFPSATYGIDMCDLHQSIAPRPLLALIENYAPRFNETAAHIRRRYQQLNVPDRFATGEAGDPHAWTVKLRLAATDWLSRWFYSRPGPTREPDFEAEKPETLYCTANGSLRYSNRGESIFTLLRSKSAALPPAISRQAVPAAIRELLLIKPTREALAVRQVEITPRKGYRVEKIEFVAEPGIYIPVWVFLAERTETRRNALLFVSESGKEADGMELGLYERMALAGHVVLAADIRGIGETKPPHMATTFGPMPFRHLFDAENAMSLMAWYMDESLFGMRVYDVMRCVDYALSRSDVDAEGLEVVGQGAGALWAMYAAALDPRIKSVVAERGLLSYRSLAQADRYTHNAGIFIRGVLLHFDLPQVAAAIAPRPLTLASPVDPMKRVVPAPTAKEAYKLTRAAYEEAGAADSFRISYPAGPTPEY